MPIDKPEVLRLIDIDLAALNQLLARYQLRFQHCAAQQSIPGSYWGAEEAGLKGDRLYARDDTPLHSILHEACHYICLNQQRRDLLDCDAGSDDAEENAVCYLQILLADELPSLGRARMFTDMDRWGYSFRLCSTRAWFEQDAEDALSWLVRHDLIDSFRRPRFTLRRMKMGPKPG